MVMPIGPVPEAIVPRDVSMPVLVLRLYIDMVLEMLLPAYTEVPSADIVMPAGLDPEAIVPRDVSMPVLVLRLYIWTVLEP
jgi:hypothetical protein